jgi:hypothetical protein
VWRRPLLTRIPVLFIEDLPVRGVQQLLLAQLVKLVDPVV